MNIVSLVNQKGGCGKTTSAVNLASGLANKGQRILLIDLDPQAHASFYLGLTPRLTTADWCEHFIHQNSVNLSDYLIQRGENLSVLGSSIGLSATETLLAEQEDKLELLTKMLAQLNPTFDWCIIDCPPNLGLLTLNALIACSLAIVPVGICELSLKGVENLHNIFKMLAEHQRRLPSIFYLVTQLDKRLKFSDIFCAKVKQRFGTHLLATMIRTNVHLREAASYGKSIFEYKKDSRGAEDYQQLAEEMQKKVESATRIQLLLKGNLFNEVYVAGEFNNWRKDKNFQLKKIDAGTWGIILPLKRGTYRYKFIVDDAWITDPDNVLVENDKFGGKNSLLFVR